MNNFQIHLRYICILVLSIWAISFYFHNAPPEPVKMSETIPKQSATESLEIFKYRPFKNSRIIHLKKSMNCLIRN